MKVLILGDGLLGTELYNKTRWEYISRKKNGIDISDISTIEYYINEYDIIVNCIGYTKTYSNERQLHWDINYKFVIDLVDLCNKHNKKLIHISTDYVYSNSNIGASEEDIPVHCNTWYGYTKLLSDAYVQVKCNNYLLIRTSFKPFPFPYDNAIVSQVGNFDYVHVIANRITALINKNATGIYNVGTEVKTIYDLAKKSNSDIKMSYNMIDKEMPTNIIMNCNKMKEFLYG